MWITPSMVVAMPFRGDSVVTPVMYQTKPNITDSTNTNGIAASPFQ